MWKVILFDLDGTLTDSGEGITKSFAYALEKGFGIHVEDYHTLKKYVGQPLAESFQECANLDEEQAREAVRLYRERYVPLGIYENRPYEGIPELLTELRAHGLTLAVASSKPTVMCEEVLRHFGLRQHFALVVGSELDGRRTHKDEVIAEILRLLEMENRKEEIVLVGDSPYDVKGAKKAGIDALSVTYGYGEREELEALWPVCIVDSVEELRNVLIGQALYGIPSANVGPEAALTHTSIPSANEGPEAVSTSAASPAGGPGESRALAANAPAAFLPPAGNSEGEASRGPASWRAQPLPGGQPAPYGYYPENGRPAPYGPPSAYGYYPQAGAAMPGGQPYAPRAGQPVPYDRMAWPYAQNPQAYSPEYPVEEEDTKPRRFGYRKSRDGHPFMAFWRVVWPPLAAFFVMELVGLVFGILLSAAAMLSSHGSLDVNSLENLIYANTAQITIAADALAFILVFFLFRADESKRKRFHWNDRILKKPSNWLIGLFVAILVGILGCIFFNWLLSIFNIASLDPVYEEMEEKIMNYSDPAVMVIGTVIVAPIFEDLLFRGVVYRRLRDYLNVPLAVIISSAAFGIFHGNIIQFLYAAALGFIFAILYEHYGTVLVPILCHLGANLTSEILNYLAPQIWSKGFQPILAIIISGVLLSITMSLVLRKKNRVNRL